jgi:hypothetical protein
MADAEPAQSVAQCFFLGLNVIVFVEMVRGSRAMT